MIEFRDYSHLGKVIRFAEEKGLLGNLVKQLDYLRDYAGEATHKAVVMPDGEYNFYFILHQQVDDEEGKGWIPWFNGGLIFYEAGDSGVGGPNFSVRLDSRESGWEIHT